MTLPRPTGARLGAAVLAAALLAGCGAAGSRGPDAGAATGGDEPLTARALAAVVAEHLGTPSSARRSTDVEEAGAGLVAAVELRYPDPGDAQADGHVLTVAVGTGFEAVAAGCDALLGQGVNGCAETEDGLVFWEAATPGEDPGVVYLLTAKGATDVLLFSSGPSITEDPRGLDLEISVEDMAAVAEDPRVDVTTTRDAVEAGQGLEFWRTAPT